MVMICFELVLSMSDIRVCQSTEYQLIGFVKSTEYQLKLFVSCLGTGVDQSLAKIKELRKG